MAQITQAGAFNSAALVVPDLYVQIVSPQTLSLNGAPTNLLGVVGSASWGPINQPVVFGTMADYNSAFGAVMARKYDVGTQVACAVQQGAAAMVGVRVTDGSELAANYALLYSSITTSYPILLTANYTGSQGNLIGLTLSSGSRSGSWKLVLQMPGRLPEVFDNVDAGGGASSFWYNLVQAVNQGTGPLRGPSTLCIASLGSGSTIMPQIVQNQVLLGGLDGAVGVGAATMVGVDGIIRSGMYALRGQGCAVALLADCDEPAQWSQMSSFGLSEGAYMIACGPNGDTIAAAVQAKQAIGIDSYGIKVLFGDWLYWYDDANGQTRLVSPLGFVAGCLSNLSPEQSSLNKRLGGIIGSQKSGLATSGQASAYSSAELQTLFSAGIDIVCNPAPGGAYWAVRYGHNSSTNPLVASDSYTRMTNFIAKTLAAGMGLYVGNVINSTLLANVRATLLGFLSNLIGQGILGSLDGSLPYAVVCSASNNPLSRTALGYVQADVQVQYQGINEKFIVNLQGGQGVSVTSASNTGG